MSLEHPNVVPIYDAGDVDGRVYLAMRLVDGSDLGTLLRAEGALEPARAIAICAQIAAALDAAHASGLVHRDVKPSNVLLDGSDHVYLADFGLTRRLDDEERPVGEDRSLGTPAYLAPEQLEGGPVDGSADLYSLGCLLYECLTGEVVFPARLAARGRVGAPRGRATEAEPRAARVAGVDRRHRRPGPREGARTALRELWGAGRRRRTGARHRHAAALPPTANSAPGRRRRAGNRGRRRSDRDLSGTRSSKELAPFRRTEHARANRPGDQEGRRRRRRGP